MVNYGILTCKGIKYMENNQDNQDSAQNSTTNTNDINSTQNGDNPSSTIKGKGITINIQNNFLIILIGILITAFISVIVLLINWGISKFDNINTTVITLETQANNYDKINKTIESINNNISGINEKLGNVEGKVETFQEDLEGFKNTISIPIYNATASFSKNINITSAGHENNILKKPSWRKDEIIARDLRTGQACKANDLNDKKILLSYTENGQDVYFLGMFDKNNKWNGTCVINIYRDNILYMITQGEYVHGNLKSYQQVTYDTKNDYEIWYISNRTAHEKYNSGETFTYFKTEDKKCDFLKNKVKSNDILYVEDFKLWIDSPLEGYYKGNTQNGYYNDKTGQAYLIKFKRNGIIRLFYQGNFVNGDQQDNTGKAWDIVVSKDKKYGYYYRNAHYANNKIDYGILIDHIDDMSGKKANSFLKEKINEEYDKLKKRLKDKCNYEFKWRKKKMKK